MKATMKVGLAMFASVSIAPLLLIAGQELSRNGSREAPAGFDNQTNGYLSQKLFDTFRSTFEEAEDIADGLGPTFNDTACKNCHSGPVTGGGSEVLETRAGTFRNGVFTPHPGGSLVQDRAINPDIQEHLLRNEDYTFRASISTLGDGFIEALADETIIGIAASQPSDVRGLVIRVPVLEANGALRVGRFGWKDQHASLESFAADAYVNEMGITSPLQNVENTSDGRSVARYDTVPDPEDDGDDVRQFAEFMRATKVPPRLDIPFDDEIAGQQVFEKIGCGTCHVGTMVTAPVGTSINGGALKVGPALASKVIHPFSDFLLHDVGTSDPIVQNGGVNTYNKVRTPPLWRLHTRQKLMHDGQSDNVFDAIRRHAGQASRAAAAYRSLSAIDKMRLLLFLRSL